MAGLTGYRLRLLLLGALKGRQMAAIGLAISLLEMFLIDSKNPAE
jgi:hypothetical protein